MLVVVQVRERPLVQTVAFISVLLAVVMSALPAFLKNLRASRFAEPLVRIARKFALPRGWRLLDPVAAPSRHPTPTYV